MKFMDNKGQMSVEYLLIVLVVILVLSIVTIPLIRGSINSSNDISHSSDAKVAVTTIVDAVNTVYANGPCSKRTVDIYIPTNTTGIEIMEGSVGKTVNIPVTLHKNASNEDEGTYTKNINATAQHNLTLTGSSSGNGWKTAEVEWFEGHDEITVTMK